MGRVGRLVQADLLAVSSIGSLSAAVSAGPSVILTLARALDRVRVYVTLLYALLLNFLALLSASLLAVPCLRGRPPCGHAEGDEQDAQRQSMSHHGLLLLVGSFQLGSSNIARFAGTSNVGWRSMIQRTSRAGSGPSRVSCSHFRSLGGSCSQWRRPANAWSRIFSTACWRSKPHRR
jgi:hypothetical protein